MPCNLDQWSFLQSIGHDAFSFHQTLFKFCFTNSVRLDTDFEQFNRRGPLT